MASRDILQGISALRRQLSASGSPGPTMASPSSLSPTSRQYHIDPPVVLDIGCRGIRAGIAGAAEPITEEVTEAPLYPLDLRDFDISAFQDRLQIALHTIYYKVLLIDGKSRKVVVLENPMMPIKIKKAVAFVIFNYFQAISVTLLPSAVCALVSAGVRSGLVVDIGWHETTVIPVIEYRPMFPILGTTIRAGRQLCDIVADAIKDASGVEPSLGEIEKVIASELYCLVDENPVQSSSLFPVTSGGDMYYVPSALKWEVVDKCFLRQAADSYDDLECKTVPSLIVDCLQRLSVDSRAQVASKIIFTGNLCKIPGLRFRILKEIRKAGLKARAINSLGAWAGASLYVSKEREYSIANIRNRNNHNIKVSSQIQSSNGTVYTSKNNYRVFGEIDRDKFLLDPEYANNIYDWCLISS
ncbi:hypothetical protein V1511DRAFT_335280 [Dipodascopsis uninucleata]